jgi:cell division protein FtsW
MRLSRAERSLVSDWWFSIDRSLIATVLALMFAGLLFSFGAGPAAADRLGVHEYHFTLRHALFLAAALVIFFWASLLSPRQMRWLAAALVLLGAALMVATLLQGIERNGAVRWLVAGGFTVQPSEIVKPGFTVLCAWLMAEGVQRTDVPATQIALGLLGLFAGLLLLQPDVGQAILAGLIWGGMFFMAGYPLRWLLAVIAVAIGGLIMVYHAVPHAAARIDTFLGWSEGLSEQTALALSAFSQGGWLGRGAGEGVLKTRLPDSHNDYIFAVIAEELGILTCLFLLGLFVLLMVRGARAAWREESPYIRLATGGLLMLIGFQALINMAVNVNLLPAKGMTLPFISYGGSSLLSMALAAGMIAGLTRRRPKSGGYRRAAVAAEFGASHDAAPARGMRT